MQEISAHDPLPLEPIVEAGYARHLRGQVVLRLAQVSP
jgi:hypothetical protein